MEIINRLFKTNNINYIVSVDDCYGSLIETIEFSEIIDQIVEKTSSYLPIISQFGKPSMANPEILSSLPDEPRRKYITEWIELLTAKELEVVKGRSEQYQLLSQKITLSNFLSELKDKKFIIDYKRFPTVEEAKDFLLKGIIELWHPEDNNKVLWLIDRDFGQEGSENEGFQLLKEFYRDECKWNIGILATQKTEDIDNEEQFNSFLDTVSNLSKNKNLIWKINKDYIDTSSINEFAKAINHGLKRNYTFKITNFLTKSLQEGIQFAGQDFKNLDQSTINNIVLNFSNDEGVSLVDTLMRALFVLTKYDLNNKINEKYDDIAKLIYDYENLSTIFDQEEFNNLSEVNKIRHLEKYNKFVNDHYYPVGFGDIFHINEGEYLLVSQPCDITIRGRGDRKIKNGLLLKIVRDKPNHENGVPLNYFKTGESHYVDLKDSLQIDLDILDLCSLNKDGISKISINSLQDTELKDQHLYSKGLRARLNDVVTRLKEVYDKRNSLMVEFNRLIDMFKLKDGSNEVEIALIVENYSKMETDLLQDIFDIRNFNIDGHFINYNIKRLCRLDSSITTSISFEYFTVNSRIGLPGDFAKEYKVTKYAVNIKDPTEFFLNRSVDPLNLTTNLNIRNSEEGTDSAIMDSVFGAVKQMAPTAERTELTYKTIGQIITLDTSILPIKVKDSDHTCIIKMETLKIPTILFNQRCDTFMKVVRDRFQLLSSNNKYRRFYSGKEADLTLNEVISFKKKEFEEGSFIFDHEGEKLLSINTQIRRIEDFSFELIMNFEENTTALEAILLQHK